ncbi:MAG TPA: tetratricopeptide repeat protein [Blastocatellia bacterium]|nr:tetratricopeptide repeat protein [Blastocatellia bacterium]
MTGARKSWLRDLVEFALDHDVNREIEGQRRLIEENPGSAVAHFNLAVLYYSQRRVGEAIAEYEVSIKCDPTLGRAYRKLGEVYINIGDYERARQYAQEAAALGDKTLQEMFERYPEIGTLQQQSVRERMMLETSMTDQERTQCTNQ